MRKYSMKKDTLRQAAAIGTVRPPWGALGPALKMSRQQLASLTIVCIDCERFR
jgi:hypothetical protein